jgi:serine/threonine-protein kinase
MSPEHISGAPDIDERADVYGFGVLFFEALTGQLPFLGDPGPALLVRILNEPAPRITLFRPDLPTPMVDIIERAMAKDAKDRFADLNDFIRAVEDHVMPPSPLPRALTPMAGVPLFSLGDQKSGPADSVVQALRRGEASGLHEINETRAMFTLPRDIAPRKTEGSEGDPPQRLGVQGHTGEMFTQPTTEVNLRPFIRGGARRLLAKRGITAALFAGVVVVVGWLAFPTPSQYRAGNDSPPPVQAVRPALPVQAVSPAPPLPAAALTEAAAPVQAAPSPTPTSAPAIAVQDAGGNAPTGSAPEVQTAPPKQHRIRTVASAKPPQVREREPEVQPADHRASTPTASDTSASQTGTHTATRTQSSSPRAGALTPDDF